MNVSGTPVVREAFVLVAGITAVLAVLLALAAVSVDVLVRFVSPEVEQRAFAGFEPALAAAGSAAELDSRRGRAQALTERLVRHWSGAPYAFRLVVLPDAEANAAALPGGHILVTCGLLDEAATENELAFVIGHELGHFAHRDHLRRLGRAALFGLALSPLLASGHSVPDLPAVMAQLTDRGFDRGQETAADRFGLSLVREEYGHVAGAADFLKRLPDSVLGRLAAYASTHPGAAARVEELQTEARRHGWPLEGPTQPF